jgi:bacterioferritin-associated ferredoxin
MVERTRCTCHGIEIEAFRRACAGGAHSVKACFQAVGCLPRCAACVPMVRKVLDDCVGRPCPGAREGAVHPPSS